MLSIYDRMVNRIKRQFPPLITLEKLTSKTAISKYSLRRSPIAKTVTRSCIMVIINMKL